MATTDPITVTVTITYKCGTVSTISREVKRDDSDHSIEEFLHIIRTQIGLAETIVEAGGMGHMEGR